MKRHRAWKAAVVILAVAAAAAAIALRDMWPLLGYAGLSAGELEEKRETAKQAEEEIRRDYRIPEITLTPEEQAALNNSEKTAEEIARELLQRQQEEAREPQAEGETPAEETPTEDEERLRSLLAQLYVLQNAFTARVDSVIEECKQEYRALDKSQQTRSNKVKIVTAKLGVITSLEKECDSQVEAILKEVEGLDPALAKELRTQYVDAKSTKKADLISRYT